MKKVMAGIDLHSNNLVIGIVDLEGKRLGQRKVDCELKKVVEFLAPYKKRLEAVAVESTYNWYWLVDGLMDMGYRVHLAHPSAIKKYEGLKHSGDFADAGYLAQLLRLGLLAEGYIYPREERGARDLARKRMQLVRYRTAQILSIENIVTRQTAPG